ncbi:MAG: hypothetical protein ACM31E_03975 [Fibrobacterota bacterium]
MIKNLSELLNRINPDLVEILSKISSIAEQYNISFFVVGATARDIYFTSSRATIDLDVGIQLASWQSYNDLIDALIKTDLFTKSDIQHRLIYVKYNYPLDIVPFGLISNADGTITWPGDKEMSVLGFKEAYEHCYHLTSEDSSNLTIRFASPPGLTAMKIISWSDSIARSQKDAQDLSLMFSEYHSILNNHDRLYETHPEILEVTDFDIVRSGTILLGKDTAAILNSETLTKVKSIIDFEVGNATTCKLANDMRIRNSLGDNLEKYIEMINDFRMGLYSGN